jgi:pyruvate/2-oxoglutarate/acetoin dehydrogenase E1 component
MRSLAFLSAFLIVFPAFAWDGYDYQKGSYVEIEKGNLVRPGKDIEIYNYSTGEYKDVEVQSIHGSGSGAEVEVYDYDTSEYRTLDMDE